MEISFYESTYKPYVLPSEVKTMDFNEIVDTLKSLSQETQTKEDVGLFNICSWTSEFTSPSTHSQTSGNERNFAPYVREELINRCKENVDLTYCLLLDVDREMTVEDAFKQWSKYEMFIYSTHSNSKDKDKFRVLLPLLEPIGLFALESRRDAMLKSFNVDKASFTISQCFHFPSYHKDNKHLAFMEHVNKGGKRFDLFSLSAVKLNQNILTEVNIPTEMNEVGEQIYNALLKGTNLHYPETLSLATVCKSYGISETNFINIITTISASDSSLKTNLVDLRYMYKTGFSTHVTKKKVRQLFTSLGITTTIDYSSQIKALKEKELREAINLKKQHTKLNAIKREEANKPIERINLYPTKVKVSTQEVKRKPKVQEKPITTKLRKLLKNIKKGQ